MEMPDSQLASLAGEGNAEAWHTLFERYQQPIYNFVYRMVDNAEDAADIVQNAFIKVFSALGQNDISNFSAYLYRTARNLSYDEIRRRRRFADVDQSLIAPEDPDIYADPQRALMLSEQMLKVRQAIGGLNEKHRAALIMRELQELDYEEMAEILESNRNAVGALLSRARLRFREELRMAQIDKQELPAECEQVIALLSPYIDGELAPQEVSNVEQHIGSCTFCAAALEEMREASRSFRMLIPVLPPAAIAKAVTGGMETAASENGSSLLRRLAARKVTWALIAGAVAVIAGAVFVAGGLGGGKSEDDSAANASVLPSGPAATTTVSKTTPAPAAVQTTTSGAEAPVETTPDDETGVPVAAPEPAPTPATETGTQADPATQTTPTPPGAPAGGQPSGVQIQNGNFFPSPSNDIQPVTFEAFVSGDAASVSVEMTYASTGTTASIFAMSFSGTGESGGMWSATQTIASGRYNVYVVALGADGVTRSQSLGVLDVYPYRRGTSTAPA